MNEKENQTSESITLMVLLTLAGGFQDAYSYNCRGKVFANAQTGNIVLFGQNLAAGQFSTALHYFFPICSFLLGVYLTEWIREWVDEHSKLHWRQIVLLVEIALLIIAGLLPQSYNTLSNVLMSFACAMQIESFRKFKGLPFATTMCIGNMRTATELLSRYHITKDKELKKKSQLYYFNIFVFAIGASVGAILSQQLGNPTIWIAAGLMALGFGLMFFQKNPL